MLKVPWVVACSQNCKGKGLTVVKIQLPTVSFRNCPHFAFVAFWVFPSNSITEYRATCARSGTIKSVEAINTERYVLCVNWGTLKVRSHLAKANAKVAANIREKLSFHNRSVEGLIHTEHSECESEVAVRRMKATDIKRKISLKDSLSPWVVPRGSTLDLRVTDRKSHRLSRKCRHLGWHNSGYMLLVVISGSDYVVE